MISSFWVKVFLINWLINIILVEFLAIRKLTNIINVDEERDSKFKAFRRPDVKWFNRPWLFLTAHFNLAKLLICFAQLFVCALGTNLIIIGTKKDTPITGIRYKLVRILHYITSCVVLYCGGSNSWMTYKRPKVCYKKFLGPDWKPDYDWKRCGSVVSNHSSFLDIPIHAMCQLPSIIAKNEVKKVPGIGPIATASQCMFLNRSSSDSKK